MAARDSNTSTHKDLHVLIAVLGFLTSLAVLRLNPSLLALVQVPGDDRWGTWAVLAGAGERAGSLSLLSMQTAWAGIQLEDTKLGQSLSGAVCAMLCTACMAASGVLPEIPSPHVSSLQVSSPAPLLLLLADLFFSEPRRQLGNAAAAARSRPQGHLPTNRQPRLLCPHPPEFPPAGLMLVAFAFGSLGTIVGATCGYLLSRASFLQHMGDSGWQVAAALTAKNIGGGLNFMGVVDALRIDANLVSAALAVDNVLGLLYFPFVMWLGRKHPGDKDVGGRRNEGMAGGGDEEAAAAGGGSPGRELTLETLSGALFVSFAIAAASNALNSCFQLPVASTAAGMAVVLATLFAPQMGRLAYSGDLVGRQLLYFFFASVGAASGGAARSLSSGMATPLVTFGIVLYLLHLAIILGAGRVLRIPLPDVLLASNANIGNPATAAAMANARGWDSRVLPAILSGTLGNIIGTNAGLLLGEAVLLPLTQIP